MTANDLIDVCGIGDAYYQAERLGRRLRGKYGTTVCVEYTQTATGGWAWMLIDRGPDGCSDPCYFADADDADSAAVLRIPPLFRLPTVSPLNVPEEIEDVWAAVESMRRAWLESVRRAESARA